MDTINVVLASDKNYAQHTAVVAASILKNTSSSVCVYILNDGILERDLERIEQTVTTLGGKVHFIDVSAALPNDIHTSGHISKAAYLRLKIAALMPQTVHRVIYLDGDLLVLEDIAKLWNTDLQGYPVGAVTDLGIVASKGKLEEKKKNIGVEGSRYFNSGVLLIDVDQWREKDYSEQLFKSATTHNFVHHDQDALNKLFLNNWYALDLKWNVIPPVYNLFITVLLKDEFRDKAVKARQNMAIQHYAGRYKPWEFVDSGKFNHKYYEYLGCTAFGEEAMPQPGKNMQGKSLSRQLWRLKIADWLTGILG